jgi:hypothetical protein
MSPIPRFAVFMCLSFAQPIVASAAPLLITFEDLAPHTTFHSGRDFASGAFRCFLG